MNSPMDRRAGPREKSWRSIMLFVAVCMNLHEYNWLRSEQEALRRFLAGIPVEDTLDLSGLESRLAEIGEQLKSVDQEQFKTEDRERLRARVHEYLAKLDAIRQAIDESMIMWNCLPIKAK